MCWANRCSKGAYLMYISNNNSFFLYKRFDYNNSIHIKGIYLCEYFVFIQHTKNINYIHVHGNISTFLQCACSISTRLHFYIFIITHLTLTYVVFCSKNCPNNYEGWYLNWDIQTNHDLAITILSHTWILIMFIINV
jgi:hypothetical protein